MSVIHLVGIIKKNGNDIYLHTHRTGLNVYVDSDVEIDIDEIIGC